MLIIINQQFEEINNDPIVANWKSIEICFKFIKERTSGEKKTLAKFIRDFVTSHQDYKRDSVVSQVFLLI